MDQVRFKYSRHGPSTNSIFTLRWRLALIYLCKHKFKHNSQDTFNPVCSHGEEVEIIYYFLSLYPNYLTKDQPYWTKLEVSILTF